MRFNAGGSATSCNWWSYESYVYETSSTEHSYEDHSNFFCWTGEYDNQVKASG